MGVMWDLSMVLICMSLTADGVQNLFTCLFSICVSSLEKCVFPLTILKSDYLSFYGILDIVYTGYMLDINALSDM